MTTHIAAATLPTLDLVLYTENGGGFFSCCTCRLENIVQFINQYRSIPKYVDSARQFGLYKSDGERGGDITREYFEDDWRRSTEICDYGYIQFVNDDQYSKYETLRLDILHPIVMRYFYPSRQINALTNEIMSRYFISPENVCVLFYRGNDKMTEIEPNSYGEYYEMAQKIYEENPQIMFLIQSDETEFVDFFREAFPKNSIVCYDYIRLMSHKNATVDRVFPDINQRYSKNFLAIVIIMSLCKYVICNTGNCSLWIALYRGNTDGLYQLLSKKIYGNYTSLGFKTSNGFISVKTPHFSR